MDIKSSNNNNKNNNNKDYSDIHTWPFLYKFCALKFVGSLFRTLAQCSMIDSMINIVGQEPSDEGKKLD